MAFDFPASPGLGTVANMPDGTQRVWDGTKWVAGGAAPTAYVPVAGGTMTGPLVLSAPPTVALGAATKGYVDGAIAAIPPPPASGLDFGRNYLHNSRFNIQQRGQGTFNTITPGARIYCADQWVLEYSGQYNNQSAQIVTLTDADRSQIGDPAARYALLVNWTGGSMGGPALSRDGVTPFYNFDAHGYNILEHFIEGIRRLAGKTVTISFWMKTSTAYGSQMSVGIQQWGMGTGGTPSAPPTPIPATVVNYGMGNTNWTRYSVTLTIPSLAGLTLGTNGDDFTSFRFWFSAAAAFPEAGGIGQPVSGANWFWGVQLEEGSTMTPLQRIDPALDMLQCQRYYQTGVTQDLFTTAGGGSTRIIPFPVIMRATPTMTGNFSTQVNGTGSYNPQGNYGFQCNANSSAPAGNGVNIYGSYTASAEF